MKDFRALISQNLSFERPCDQCSFIHFTLVEANVKQKLRISQHWYIFGIVMAPFQQGRISLSKK